MNQIIKYITQKINTFPSVALVLGSGLADLQNILSNKIIINYSDIPGYFNTTVKGHEGKFIFGTFNNNNILIAVGRFHYYEGLSFDETGLPIKIFHSLGCKQVILTNSSGCLVNTWRLGDIMVVNGHYDFSFRNSIDNPDLVAGNNYYNEKLIKLARSLNQSVRVGTYGWVLGPMYETNAEIQNMISHGVNAVGMSTVPEVVMAHNLGVDILVLALMSNYGVGLTKEPLSHEIVLENSKKYNKNFKLLLMAIISEI